MKVLQLIDSLRPGGAEKMAVNIANELLPHVEISYLCCTRQEGLLKEQLEPEVNYIFLKKKSSLDLLAILKLKRYINKNQITHVHAHSTSFFIASILKLSGSKFKLFWHDHYGESDYLEKREFKLLRMFSGLFDGIISVNTVLKQWAVENLKCNKVTELKNFIPDLSHLNSQKIKLKGGENNFKIICVANLRPQKDHFTLLKAFELIHLNNSVSLHLVGEDPGTPYSTSLLSAVKVSSAYKNIFYYGTHSEVYPLLKQSDLAVLPSRSEGLPLALLEYGMAGLPVVCTQVGKCVEVLGENGIIVPPKDSTAMAEGILQYYNNRTKREKDALKFKKRIEEKFSARVFLDNLLDIYKMV